MRWMMRRKKNNARHITIENIMLRAAHHRRETSAHMSDIYLFYKSPPAGYASACFVRSRAHVEWLCFYFGFAENIRGRRRRWRCSTEILTGLLIVFPMYLRYGTFITTWPMKERHIWNNNCICSISILFLNSVIFE